VLYPQDGARIVTMDSVTSLHATYLPCERGSGGNCAYDAAAAAADVAETDRETQAADITTVDDDVFAEQVHSLSLTQCPSASGSSHASTVTLPRFTDSNEQTTQVD